MLEPGRDPVRHRDEVGAAEVAGRDGQDPAGRFGHGGDRRPHGTDRGALLEAGGRQRHDGRQGQAEREEEPGARTVAYARPRQTQPGAHGDDPDHRMTLGGMHAA